MNRRLSLIAVTLALTVASCSNDEPTPSPVGLEASAPVGEISNKSAPEYAKPLTTSNIDKVLARLARSDDMWSQELSRSTSDDSYSNGKSTFVQFPAGAAKFYFNENGLLWNVKLMIGIGDQCGAGIKAGAALDQLSDAVELPAMPRADFTRLASAFNSDAIESFDSDTYKMNVGGGCIDQLSIKAS